MRINGGFFIFKKEIFDYMREKEELVIEPFHRLIEEKQLIGYPTTASGPAWTPSRTGSSWKALYSERRRPLGSLEDQWQRAKLSECSRTEWHAAAKLARGPSDAPPDLVPGRAFR